MKTNPLELAETNCINDQGVGNEKWLMFVELCQETPDCYSGGQFLKVDCGYISIAPIEKREGAQVDLLHERKRKESRIGLT